MDVNNLCDPENRQIGNTIQTELSTIPKEVIPLIKKYKDIFEGHGKLVGHECKLYIDESVIPVYQKMRKQPYHLRKKIDQELSRLEQAGIIESVIGPQEWASNLVATPKSNGNVRLCLDSNDQYCNKKRNTSNSHG